MIWQLRTKQIDLSPDHLPVLMGIVNVTPDSFSDGGRFFEPNRAIDHALYLAESGAGILDVGGESTRPYSESVSEAEELRRVVSVVEGICQQCEIPVSIDTSKSRVAREAIEAGAEIINDVTGLEGDPEMVSVAIDTMAGVCAMHMQGTPQTMQDDPSYENVVEEIFDYLAMRQKSLLAAGVDQSRICLDPGIGFGKTHEHNIELLQGASRFLDLGAPILVGHSRKGFIAKLMGDKEADRCAGTLGVSLALALAKVHVIRVHDVRETQDALRTFRAAMDLNRGGI